MNDTLLQMLIFFIVSTIGSLTRLLYLPAAILQKKVGNKLFSAILDVSVALLGAAMMMLVSILMSGSVRIFYAIFFLIGIITTHITLKKAEDLIVKFKFGKKRSARKKAAP